MRRARPSPYPAGALAGYRAATGGYRDLGLAWDEAVLGVEAALALRGEDPEVAARVERSRVIITGLRATPMLALLDRAAVGAPGPAPLADPVDAAPS